MPAFVVFDPITAMAAKKRIFGLMKLWPVLATMLTVGALTSFPIVGVTEASAQTKPMHSGHLSHGAPQMRKHGSGLHRPNRPHYHHHKGHHGYRPVHTPQPAH